MPFTFAHPAAALPLRGPLRRFGLLDAFVIGSMTPDFWYFLPVDVLRVQTHSVPALFTFCLPWGLLIYLVYRLIMLRPALGLLAPVLRRIREAPPVPVHPLFWCGVVLSLILGAATHIAWDSVTHSTGPAVMAHAWLRRPLLPAAAPAVPLYLALQHLSTVLGLALVAAWMSRALRLPRAATGSADLSWPSSLPSRGVCAGLLALTAVATTVAQLPVLGRVPFSGFARLVFARSVTVLWLAALLLSLCWWLARWSSRARTEW